MDNEYDIIARLTSGQVLGSERNRILNDFAQTLGWLPTDRFDAQELTDSTTAHLLVEHGLEHTAVISFFRYPRRYSDLSIAEVQRLLAISYNNLVDWHIQVQSDEVLYVFNRLDPPQVVESFLISRREAKSLRSDAFEQITGVGQIRTCPVSMTPSFERFRFGSEISRLNLGMLYRMNSFPLSSTPSFFFVLRRITPKDDTPRRGSRAFC